MNLSGLGWHQRLLRRSNKHIRLNQSWPHALISPKQMGILQALILSTYHIRPLARRTLSRHPRHRQRVGASTQEALPTSQAGLSGNVKQHDLIRREV